MAPNRRGNNTGGAGRKKAALTKQQFTSMLNARREMKYYTDNDETTVAADGSLGLITQPIITGDTADTHDGSQYNISKLDLILTLALNASATIDSIRFIVFADMQANGVYPAVTDVLVAADPNASLTRSVVVEKRFKILHDVMFTLTNTGANRIIVHRRSLNLKNHKVFARGTTNVESANGRGALYYIMCGDLTTNNTAYNLDWAVKYYDS